jgi:dienelactone hydrolase
MHELPGLTEETFDFGRRVAYRGFTVYLPLLFGEPSQSASIVNLVKATARVCISREFHILAARQSSPITRWLRALCRQLHRHHGGPGVGAIGMCLTGGFALSMMVDRTVMAPVLSQPSLPFGLTPGLRAALGVTPEELAAAKERAAEGVTLLGLRFTNDVACPRARFEALRREFGDRFIPIEIESPDARYRIRRLAHSVLTFDYRPGDHPTHRAFERVIAFLERSLRP